jgi:hypothetical protein
MRSKDFLTVFSLMFNRSAENADPLPALDNAMAARDTVSRLITNVYEGKLHPRVATGLASLMHLQLRAIETTSLEQRLTKIEKKLEKLATKSEAKIPAKSRRDEGEPQHSLLTAADASEFVRERGGTLSSDPWATGEDPADR